MPGYSSIKLASKYAAFLLKAKKLHGVHSPFIYRFSEEVLYNGHKFYAYDAIEFVRSELLNNKEVIEVTDFGAGSRIFQSNKRSVKAIARHVLLQPKYGQLLFRMVEYFNPKTIIELGTALGITSLYLAYHHKNTTLHTFEGCPNTAAFSQQVFQKLNVDNIVPHIGPFDDTLPDFLNTTKSVDFAFVDGNHTYEATMRYFNLLLPKIHEDTVLVFDDIHLSEEMEQAWEAIKENPTVTCSVDVFKFGIVFFKPGKKKEDFVLRY